MDHDLLQVLETSVTPWPYSLLVGPQAISRSQPPKHTIPSRGTASTDNQSECQITRLVSSLPSHKNVQRSACGKPIYKKVTFDTSPQHLDPFTPILLGIIFHSATNTMPSTAQYVVYSTFVWSVSMCYFHAASATESLNQFTMYDCGSTQISQPLIQQYSLNTPDLCSNASQIYYPPLRHQSIQVLQIPK